jgi:hypothetical protein
VVEVVHHTTTIGTSATKALNSFAFTIHAKGFLSDEEMVIPWHSIIEIRIIE